ncbi:LOW QUALITY PROTEIN: cGMP-dependent protein kinase 1 [Enoplosus armatus]|uniref:LOW QUALITY PROTEIN: cGMP-dependent protein kinase 1 n=1 Tax=Enoplosus armatus TaxID=215367 RepID=UPI003993085F
MFTAQFAGDPPLPRARKYPKDPLTQLGSSPCISHSSLRCLGHVIACCLCPAPASPEQERSIFHLGGYRGDLHLSDGPSAAKQGQTNSGQVRKTSTTPDRLQVVMGTLRDLQFALQLKIEELRQRDTLIDELELELDTKDELIRRLQEELDRYRATVSLPGPSAASAACSAQIEDKQRAKRKTVISEPFSLDPVTLAMVSHRSCDKSQESQRLIQAAFLRNDLLKNLDEGEIKAITACMYPTTINQGCYVIQEGTNGAQAYVLEEGRLDVTKDGLKLLTIEPEDMFGELALLYNCSHSFSVSAQADSKLWVIDRKSYQTILMQSGLNSLSHSMELLSSVPFLQSLPEDVIMKMSDLMEETHYAEGDYIIRQGATGDTFYVISKGQVKVTEEKRGHEEQTVLSERQWFGEKALWGEDVRTVNVIAAGEVTCSVIDRETFKDIIGGLVFDCSHEVQKSHESRSGSDMDPELLSSATLSDFQMICTLAVGEFGHVDLVQLKSNIKCVFAMRVLKKKLILNNGQREHILREGRILMETHCPFIVRLHKTFRDTECLYILTEACLGGDLWSLLKDKGCLDECSTRFYTACAVEALTFLHCRGVIYRDVKPENVVLDEHGYAKLIGSRCLKKVEVGQKTWTFCGTLGYMAPEIILNKGHSTSADFWSLGVFVFDLLSGGLPFSGSDPTKILTATIRGIDQIHFPKTISKSASSLIKKLCRSNPSERLGSQRNGAKDIQKHKWFEGFNWDGLCKGTLNSPAIPKVKHPVDSSARGHYTEGSVELCTNWDDF